MKYCTTIILLFFIKITFAQDKDRRAALNIEGRVNEISVSPDGSIWLVTALNNIYYTTHIDSNWHHTTPTPDATKAMFSFSEPHLERVSFFNKDTAILTGYISPAGQSIKNGLYFTANGGRTWKPLTFEGDSWIYDACVDKSGNAWMGGSSGIIFHSSDFGQHWHALNSPYDGTARMHSIFMLDASRGISGALSNAIYSTANNWKTHQKIATPFDQKKYENGAGYNDNRIEKILYWKNYIVVNQSGHIFYSDSEHIDWKEFPMPLYNFELDPKAQKLFAITKSLEVVLFSSPAQYQTLTKQPLPRSAMDMQVVNHSLYMVDGHYEVARVNAGGIKRVMPHTTDWKIEQPEKIRKGKKLTWGISDKQIYLSEGSQDDWYRAGAVDFFVANFKLQSDSVAILWDGSNNYLYSLKNHRPELYHPKNPLQKFLAVPLKSFSINSGNSGCFHGAGQDVSYEKTDASTFATAAYTSSEHQKEDQTRFRNRVSAYTLSGILCDIDSNPGFIPSFKDFKITEQDKENYLDWVDRRLKGEDTDLLLDKGKPIDKTFYYSIPAKIDTLNNSILAQVLNLHEGYFSTSRNWFGVKMVNENNDTISVWRTSYVKPQPWNLPWKVEYDGLVFNCYSIQLSKYLDACLPNDFMGRHAMDNKLLLMDIADYLYRKE